VIKQYRKVLQRDLITVFDLETTGLNPAMSDIITGYFITYNSTKSFSPLDQLYVELRPDVWGIEAERFHGISYVNAMDFPPKTKGLASIFKYMHKYKDSTFVCHANYNNGRLGNYYYDWKMIEFQAREIDKYWGFIKTFHHTKVISTHTIAKQVLDLKGYSLDKLCKHFDIELDHHNCKSDAIATANLYKRLIELETKPL
jgi:DNA polymerase III epsilon subunit-like protein